MKAARLLLLLFCARLSDSLLVPSAFLLSTSPSSPPPLPPSASQLSSSLSKVPPLAPRDHTDTAIALFSHMLTPSVLLSGAIYGSMFALPLSPSDSPATKFLYRLYTVFSSISWASSLTSVISTTVALQSLRFQNSTPTGTLREFIDANCATLWSVSFVNFLYSLLGFFAIVTVRAWHQISCPKLARCVVFLNAGFATLMINTLDSYLYSSSTNLLRTVLEYHNRISFSFVSKADKEKGGKGDNLLGKGLRVLSTSLFAVGFGLLVEIVAAAVKSF